MTEGDRLRDRADPWPAVRAALDEVWATDIDDAVRIRRLIARHVPFGKSAARAWIESVDEPNAIAIKPAMDGADLRVDPEALDMPLAQKEPPPSA